VIVGRSSLRHFTTVNVTDFGLERLPAASVRFRAGRRPVGSAVRLADRRPSTALPSDHFEEDP